MTSVYAFLATGFEEVECLAVVDVLRRAGIETALVSTTGSLQVTGSHNITVQADILLEDADWDGTQVFFLPGGMPGAANLAGCKELTEHLVKAFEEGKRLAAICAGPSVLGGLGLLAGKRATCYPGFEDQLKEAQYQKNGVVTDGTVTTARGLGYALDLGLEIVRLLIDEETAGRIKASIQYDQC